MYSGWPMPQRVGTWPQRGVSWATRRSSGGWGSCPSAGMDGTTWWAGRKAPAPAPERTTYGKKHCQGSSLNWQGYAVMVREGRNTIGSYSVVTRRKQTETERDYLNLGNTRFHCLLKKKNALLCPNKFNPGFHSLPLVRDTFRYRKPEVECCPFKGTICYFISSQKSVFFLELCFEAKAESTQTET